MKKQGQLHELLAVESDLRTARDKQKKEIVNDFITKPGIFLGACKTLTMFDENRVQEQGEDKVDVDHTVTEHIKLATDSFVQYWDMKLQKETANQEAKAHVIVDGKTLFSDLPVTFILGMEEELRQLRSVYECAPTLKPGVTWASDGQKGRGIYKSQHPDEKNKTQKSVEFTVMVPATEFHPAQVKEWSEDKTVGKYVTETWSGMISEADRAFMLSRVDKLLRAFKQARQRANCQATSSMDIGKEIITYIHARN